MKETIIQFGEGNFLRGFVDDFIDTLNRKGLYEGSIVVVKPRPERDGGSPSAFRKLTSQQGRYNLILRGIENRQSVSRMKEIHSISRTIDPYQDYEAFLALARQPEMRFIVSNTTEAGIVFDESCQFADRPALSFPGKLTQLMYERFRSGLKGFILLPCELIDNNAAALKSCVLRYADLWRLEEAFKEWIEKENTFANTLVDRIVTGYPKEEAAELTEKIGWDDQLIDTAEPYHLWAIEGNFENELPLTSAGLNVVWTDDITPVKKRKVRILNGAHTVMVFPALLYGLETVGDCMKDETVSTFLKHYLFEYAVPLLHAREDQLADDRPEDQVFAKAVLERFANPFIHHQLRSIALNSVSKFRVRVLPTAIDCLQKNGYFPKAAAFSLAALIRFYKTDEPQDDPAKTAFLREHTVEEIVRNSFWGISLEGMLEEVKTAYDMIETGKIKEGFLWAMS